MPKLQENELNMVLKSNENKMTLGTSGQVEDFASIQEESGRCLRCDCRKSISCRLRKYCTEYEVDKNKYKLSSYPPFKIFGRNEEVIYEPGKCIKCGLCVEITEQTEEELGLTFIGRGFDTSIQVPFNRALEEGLKKSAAACIEACPTAALAYRTKEDD